LFFRFEEKIMLNLSTPLIISRVLTLIIALTVHEFAHAFTADRFGDDTPRIMGRLTLNPLKHLDVMGSLLLIVAGFGWAKPTPINPAKLRQHSKSAILWVSLAGPFSNFLLACLVAFPLRFNLIPALPSSTFLPSLSDFSFTFFVINLVLMVFNLLPLPPLDGEKVLEYFLPEAWAENFAKIKPYGPIALLVIVFVLPYFHIDIISFIMTPILTFFRIVLLGV
jgi:Zn-dependent protease